MHYSFLESIYNDYAAEYMDDLSGMPITESEIQFKQKYIAPILATSRDEAEEMSEIFVCALADSNKKAFQNGFKACIRFLAECLN